jgi:hypothetical protein
LNSWHGFLVEFVAEESAESNAESEHGAATDPEEDQISIDEATFAQKWHKIVRVSVVT